MMMIGVLHAIISCFACIPHPVSNEIAVWSSLHFYTCFTEISAEVVHREDGFKKWVDMLKAFMVEEFHRPAHTPGRNHRLVRFDITNDDVTLQVDLLVSPYWNYPKDFYNFLRHIPKEKRDM